MPREDNHHHCDLVGSVSALIRPHGTIRSPVADVCALCSVSKEVFKRRVFFPMEDLKVYPAGAMYPCHKDQTTAKIHGREQI